MLGLISWALERTQLGGGGSLFTCFSSALMTVHPLGVRTSVHILAVWVQGLREGAECFTVDGLCKNKKFISEYVN